MPTAEGGIALRFSRGDRRALVEFLNDGSTDVTLYDANGLLEDGVAPLATPSEIVDSLESYLSR
jgi:hypothetical protein